MRGKSNHKMIIKIRHKTKISSSNGHECGQSSIHCLVRSKGVHRLAWPRYDVPDRIPEAFQAALDPRAPARTPEEYSGCVSIWGMKT